MYFLPIFVLKIDIGMDAIYMWPNILSNFKQNPSKFHNLINTFFSLLAATYDFKNENR